jgi:hypothetical protein
MYAKAGLDSAGIVAKVFDAIEMNAQENKIKFV